MALAYSSSRAQAPAPRTAGLRAPIWVYNDWSSYDELSDNIPLTEKLAMREFDELLRLRKLGVHFDYYMMDAFWFDPDGAYRTWKKPNWPQGPDRWLAACKANGILPGMWFSSNSLIKINAATKWKDSLDPNLWQMSLSEGGFLPDLMGALQFWYDRGVRMFEFDFAYFTAATAKTQRTQTPEQIQARNEQALRDALQAFRRKNSDAVFVGYNGFGGDLDSTYAPFPFKTPVNPRWLDVFDSIYSGDPRPADVPEQNFWRSMDVYSDHMVRRFEQSAMPLPRVDSTGFMIGDTGTNFYRKTNAWQGMLILMIARGGWINTVHGNLEFLDEGEGRWFAKVQALYDPLKKTGRTKTFGGIPGDVKPYGFASADSGGALYATVNPAQGVETLRLPPGMTDGAPAGGRVLFRDAGFEPVLAGDSITLGPGQMALVGYGRYADAADDLGVQKDVVIPRAIEPLEVSFSSTGATSIEGVVAAPAEGDLRVVMRQHSKDGTLFRSLEGAPPTGLNMGKFFTIEASQDGKPLPVSLSHDKVVWAGLSWAVGEISHAAMAPGKPVFIRCSSAEKKEPVFVEGKVYRVEYGLPLMLASAEKQSLRDAVASDGRAARNCASQDRTDWVNAGAAPVEIQNDITVECGASAGDKVRLRVTKRDGTLLREIEVNTREEKPEFLTNALKDALRAPAAR